MKVKILLPILFVFIYSCGTTKKYSTVNSYLFERNFKAIKKIAQKNPSFIKRKNCKDTHCKVHEYYSVLDYLSMYRFKSDKEDEALVRFLIKHGADCENKAYMNYYIDPLAKALESGRNNIAQILIDECADIEDVDFNKNSALMLAAKRHNNVKMLKFLLEKGANVNHENLDGLNALAFALSVKNNVENIKFLLENKAELPKNYKPLFFDYENLNVLTDFGINIINDYEYISKINYVLYKYEKFSGIFDKINNMLTEDEAAKRIVDIDPYKITMFRLRKHFKPIKGEINFNGNDYLAVIHKVMRSYNNEFIVKSLNLCEKKNKDCKKFINSETYMGFTPLMQAVIQNNMDMIDFLLSKCADINHQNRYGITALHLAVLNDNENIIKLLLKRGADLNLEDMAEFSPKELYIKMYSKHINPLDVEKVICEKDGDGTDVKKNSDTPETENSKVEETKTEKEQKQEENSNNKESSEDKTAE